MNYLVILIQRVFAKCLESLFILRSETEYDVLCIPNGHHFRYPVQTIPITLSLVLSLLLRYSTS